MGLAKKLAVLAFATTLFGIVSASLPILFDHQDNNQPLNLEQDEMGKKCEARLKISHKFITNIVESINEYLYSNLEYRQSERENGNNFKCEEDVWLKSMFEHLIKMTNLCIDPPHRLDINSTYAKKILRIICDTYNLAARHNDENGWKCIHEFANKQEVCSKKFNRFGSTLLHMLHNPQKCRETIEYIKCSNDVTSESSCSESMIEEVQYLRNRTLQEIYGCFYEGSMLESLNDNEEVINTNLPPKEKNLTRFTISKDQLLERCEEKGYSAKTTLANFLAEFALLTLRRQFKMSLAARVAGITEKEELHSLVKENCNHDAEVKQMIKNIYDSVELCLGSEVLFDQGTKEEMLLESTNIMCKGIESAMWIVPKDECFKDIGIFLKKALCNNKQDSSKQQVYTNMPLPFYPSQRECNNIYQMHGCEMEIFKDCTDDTKIELKKQYNLQRELNGCKMYNI